MKDIVIIILSIRLMIKDVEGRVGIRFELTNTDTIDCFVSLLNF